MYYLCTILYYLHKIVKKDRIVILVGSFPIRDYSSYYFSTIYAIFPTIFTIWLVVIHNFLSTYFYYSRLFVQLTGSISK